MITRNEDNEIVIMDHINLMDENTPFNWFNVGDADMTSEKIAQNLVAANQLAAEINTDGDAYETQYLLEMVYEMLCEGSVK